MAAASHIRAIIAVYNGEENFEQYSDDINRQTLVNTKLTAIFAGFNDMTEESREAYTQPEPEQALRSKGGLRAEACGLEGSVWRMLPLIDGLTSYRQSSPSGWATRWVC